MRVVRPEQFEPVIRFSNYFSVDPGEIWGPRTIPDLELVYIVQGCFFYRDENVDEFTFGPGDMLLIPPEVEHTLGWRRGRKAKISCLHCEPIGRPRYVEGTYKLDPAPQLLTATGRDGLLRSLLQQCAQAFAGAGRFRRKLVTSLVRSIWLRLAEYWQPSPPDMPSIRVEQMAEFLRERYRDPVGRLDLAEQFHLTPQYVNVLFKRELGVTPVDFINQLRAEKAFELLCGGMSVKDTAEAVGFSDAFYFSKVFKRIRGVSPSEVACSR
jgi:AraC-like DNA-binding protein